MPDGWATRNETVWLLVSAYNDVEREPVPATNAHVAGSDSATALQRWIPAAEPDVDTPAPIPLPADQGTVKLQPSPGGVHLVRALTQPHHPGRRVGEGRRREV